MKEILYYGKNINDGEWVEGDLVTNGIDYETAIRINDKSSSEYGQIIRVDPDTVSQFTGLRDKNGERIYEGDILQDNNGHFGVVIWKEKAACFLVKWIVVSEFGNEEEDDCFDFKIVGNKWDNPELLEHK